MRGYEIAAMRPPSMNPPRNIWMTTSPPRSRMILNLPHIVVKNVMNAEEVVSDVV